MTGEMVVALGSATLDGTTLFGHANRAEGGRDAALYRSPGKAHAAGEQLRIQGCEVPQARQTFAVVGSQPAACWGLIHGLNDQGVGVGLTNLPLGLAAEAGGLLGTDLVRLVLERARSARQAVDLLLDTIERYRLASAGPCSGQAFLLADGTEAYLIEAVGRYWVLQSLEEMRAAGDLATIRQNWGRIAPGLAELAIHEKKWAADGSKLDFATAFAEVGSSPAHGAWQRNDDLLRQAAGHIDLRGIRGILTEGMSSGRTVCLTARLTRDRSQPPIAWFSWGPTAAPVYLPVVVEADLPSVWTQDVVAGTRPSFCRQLVELRERMARDAGFAAHVDQEFKVLQERLDQEADEWAAEATPLKQRGDTAEFQRRAGLFMEHASELAEGTMENLLQAEPPVRVAR